MRAGASEAIVTIGLTVMLTSIRIECRSNYMYDTVWLCLFCDGNNIEYKRTNFKYIFEI